jgi:hypothetical protein
MPSNKTCKNKKKIQILRQKLQKSKNEILKMFLLIKYYFTNIAKLTKFKC